MKRLIGTITLLLLPMTANAEGTAKEGTAKDGGWYAGIAGGSTDIETGITAVSGATLDETGTGISFFFGKEINEKLSIEGFYADLGKASLSGDNGDTFTFGGTAYQFNTTASITVSAKSTGIAGKAKFDMGDSLQGYVKGGFHSWDADAKIAAGTASASTKTDGTDILWGVGAEYKMGEKTSLLAGYDNFKLDDETVTYLHAGMLFRF